MLSETVVLETIQILDEDLILSRSVEALTLFLIVGYIPTLLRKRTRIEQKLTVVGKSNRDPQTRNTEQIFDEAIDGPHRHLWMVSSALFLAWWVRWVAAQDDCEGWIPKAACSLNPGRHLIG